MTDEPILISRKRSSKLLGISVGTFDMLRRRGLIEAVLIGKRKLFRLEDVRALALTPRQRKALSRDCVGFVQ
jgi:hypothetical protein